MSFEGEPGMIGEWMRRGLAALLVGATLAVFWPATGNDFIPYDDPVYVTKNPHVLAGFSREGFRWSLGAHEGGNWHPLTWWSHMLDVQLYGRQARGHHATNALLHACSTAALFCVLSALTGALWPAFFTAALFALHPLHVESVAWVSERKDVLAAFFWMLALGAYLGYARHRGRGRYLGALALFALALMSKPMAVTLPLVFLLLDFWPLDRFRRGVPARGAVRLVVEKAPFLLLAAVLGYLTIETQTAAGGLEPFSNVPEPFRVPMLSMRLANAVSSYAVYLGQTLWPADLAVFYPYPAHALAPWRVGAAGLGLAVVTALVFRARHRAPFLMLGWCWYLVVLLPVIGLLQVGVQAHADRYTYLPLIGIFIMVAWGIGEFGRRRAGYRGLLAVLALLALVVSGGLAVRQIGFWRDGLSLFGHALEVTQRNHVARRVLGEIMMAKGDFVAAEGHFRSELEIAPRSTSAHNKLGMALTGQGRFEEAVDEYREAVRLNPRNYEALNNLGVHLTALGRFDAADAYLRAALLINPGSAEIHANLGDNLTRQGSISEAIVSYRRALELKSSLAQVRAKLEMLTSGR